MIAANASPSQPAKDEPKGFKGLVLAAGYGSRMAPLTEVTPKPLLPFFTSTIIEFALLRLEPVSSKVTINSYHLKDRMIAYFDQYHSAKGFNIFLEDELLGTGGTIASLKDWLGDDDLIVYNSDIYSNVNMQAVIDHHISEQAAATMVLLPQPIPGKTVIYRGDTGILAIGGDRPRLTQQPGHMADHKSVHTDHMTSHTDHMANHKSDHTDHKAGHGASDKAADGISEHLFTGIHILSNRFVKEMPDVKPYQVVDQYKSFLGQNEKIAGFIYDGPWFDIGEPHHFFDAIEQLTTTYQDQLNDVLEQLKATGRARHPYWKSAGGKRHGEHNKVYCFGEKPAGLTAAEASSCVFLGGNTPVGEGESFANALYLDDKKLGFTPVGS